MSEVIVFPLKLGSQGPEVTELSARAVKRYSKIAFEVDGITPLKADGYFGRGEQQFAEKWQYNMKRPVTGQITRDEWNFIVKGIDFPTGKVPTKIGWWIYTCPGSGADFTVGPSFEIGKWAEEVHGIRHQPVKFLKGGYMGLLGGDATASYVDVTYDQYKSIEWLLDRNEDLQRALALVNGGTSPVDAIRQTSLNLLFSGYSQSADGLEDALEILFGDGGFVIPKTGEVAAPGKYRALRGAIRRVIQFGNPSRQPGQASGQPGWNPKGWGISRKIRPAWLVRVTVSITNRDDFYACVPNSDDIRPPFYAEVITSEVQLPYFVHLLNIGVRVVAQWVPLVGGLLSTLGGGGLATALAGMAQLGQAGTNLLSGFMGQTALSNHDTEVDDKLVKLLSAQGVFTHLDDLVGLVMDLPGLQRHGEYWISQPEYGGRSGQQVGCDEINLVVAGKL